TTVHEVRRLLRTDRVGVFKFNPDWSGQFIMESINGGWVKLVDNTSLKNLRENILCEGLQSMAGLNNFQSDIKDTYLQDNKGGIYRKKKHFACHDVYKSNFPSCYVQLLEQFEAKAYISVPIFKGDQLWGLLATYQNSAARHWEESEINLMTQIGDQLGIALQQADFLQQLQAQSQQLALAAEREKQAKEQLQQGAIQLLSSVAPVLMGDLTVRAVVTEDEVGTIADAYNNTIQSLRQLVMQIQTAAIQLAQTSQNSEVSIVELSTQAQGQLSEINHASAEIQAMVKSTEAVTTNAQQVEVAVQKANTTVKRSGDAMNRTVEGIQGIRKTVSVTREKIKRLSESSQNISKVVSLISNFATQTNLLALNAARQATRAGEYGKGFAVVADEVRSLARQSAAATAEIEALVAEIQTETTQVATAMELGIRQVVKGNELVDETKESLTAIVTATAQISELVKGIVEATQMQEVRSQSVTKTMTNVAGIASHTSDDAIQLATSFKQLLGLAETLQTSVGKFKV
ncbi:MAG: methyl-accepting chemotaxis protein, partial [Microcoleaceae cyanobacterium]